MFALFGGPAHTIIGATDAVLWHGESNGYFVRWAWIFGSDELSISSFVAFFFVQVRLFVLILLYNCFLYELLMQEVRIYKNLQEDCQPTQRKIVN